MILFLNMTQDIYYAEKNQLAIFSFSRPHAKNALTLEMLDFLKNGILKCNQSKTLRAVLIRGKGDLPFSAGFNLNQISDDLLTAEEAIDFHKPIRDVASAIRDCRLPVIGAAQRFVFGAALDIYLHCDLRVCTSTTVFCMPPNRYGFLYPSQGIERMVNVLGLARATEMLMIGSTVNSQYALQNNLVHQCCADQDFEGFVEIFCASVSSNAPLSMRGTKRILNDLGRGEIDQKKMYQEIANSLNSLDAQEGRLAFMEKRTPQFKGK